MDYFEIIHSPLGSITLASDGEALIGLWFEGQKYFEAKLGESQENHDLPVFEQAHMWLNDYFSGKDPGSIPPVHMRGTAFQQQVWELLSHVAYGQLTTYGELARRLESETGKHTSARAVGAAVGRNPLSIILPCHRVIGSTGSLTGYAGGLERKVALLQLEHINLAEKLSHHAKNREYLA